MGPHRENWPPASGRHPRRESVAVHLTLLSFTAETQGSADLQFDLRIVNPEFEEAMTGLCVFVTDEDPPARAGASIVLARRLEDGEPATFGVNAFTDFFGSFAIDGLEPGSYVVKAIPSRSPMRISACWARPRRTSRRPRSWARSRCGPASVTVP